MGLFSRNKQIVSDEYEKLASRIIEIKADLSLLQKDMEVMKTNMHSLRGLVNRKLGKYEEDEEDEKQPTDLATLQKQLMGLQ